MDKHYGRIGQISRGRDPKKVVKQITDEMGRKKAEIKLNNEFKMQGKLIFYHLVV
jgi:hypothetical protein